MSRGPCTFRQRDLTAAIKALQAAGVKDARVEVEKGKIVVVIGNHGDTPASADKEELVSEWPALPGRSR